MQQRRFSTASQEKRPRVEAMKKQEGQGRHLSSLPQAHVLGVGICWPSFRFGRLSGLWVFLTPSRLLTKLDYGWSRSLYSKTTLFRMRMSEASSGLSTKDWCLKRSFHLIKSECFPGLCVLWKSLNLWGASSGSYPFSWGCALHCSVIYSAKESSDFCADPLSSMLDSIVSSSGSLSSTSSDVHFCEITDFCVLQSAYSGMPRVFSSAVVVWKKNPNKGTLRVELTSFASIPPEFSLGPECFHKPHRLFSYI